MSATEERERANRVFGPLALVTFREFFWHKKALEQRIETEARILYYGITEEEIAKNLGVSHRTLRKWYSKNLPSIDTWLTRRTRELYIWLGRLLLKWGNKILP